LSAEGIVGGVGESMISPQGASPLSTKQAAEYECCDRSS
jgi:hypothetical protein